MGLYLRKFKEFIKALKDVEENYVEKLDELEIFKYNNMKSEIQKFKD